MEKTLLKALHGLKEMSEQMEQKQQLKFWSDISVPLSLNDALSRLSKDELSEIRKCLDIKSASHLKKGELAELLSTTIPNSLQKICLTMDQERFSFVMEIIRNGGSIAAPKLTEQQVAYFRSSGIIFTGTYKGRKILAMPEEIVRNAFFQVNDKDLSSICKRNTDWIKLTQGLLYFYGTLSIGELIDFLNKYTDELISVYDYLQVMDHAKTYYEQFRFDSIGVSYRRVFDPENIKREHQMRKGVEFFPFSREQLLRAGENGFVDRNDSYLQFVQFLTNHYKISRKEADGIVEECVYATNNGEGPNQILQFLQSRFEFDTLDALRACMDQVVKLMNNTRQWFLKGFMPSEHFTIEKKLVRPLPSHKSKTIKKIGRNDQCHCGSNKKYKLCCGRSE